MFKDPEKAKEYYRNLHKRKWANDPAYKERMLNYNKTYLPKYVEEHRDQIREYSNKHREKYKREVLLHYSEDDTVIKCARCGFDEKREEEALKGLSVDHIDGGGRKHFEEIGCRGGYKFYKWLRDNKYPKGFRVLCMTCQFIVRPSQEPWNKKETKKLDRK